MHDKGGGGKFIPGRSHYKGEFLKDAIFKIKTKIFKTPATNVLWLIRTTSRKRSIITEQSLRVCTYLFSTRAPNIYVITGWALLKQGDLF